MSGKGSEFSPVGSSKMNQSMTNSRRKRAPSASTSRNAIILLSMLIVVILMFVVIAYVSHLKIGKEFDSSPLFVFNRIHTTSSAENVSSQNQVSLIDSPIPSFPVKKKVKEPINLPNDRVKTPSVPPPVSDRFEKQLTPEDYKIHTLTCPHSDLVTFWKSPTTSDLKYKSPFNSLSQNTKYVTFEPDVGGWNNIRMQMELVLVFAYATGRIFVMPPDQPMYLLNQGKGHQKAHGFVEFFPFEFIKKRMPVISMEEFMEREGITGHLFAANSSLPKYPPGNKTVFVATERDERLKMWEYLRAVGACPKWESMSQFLVIPSVPGKDSSDLTDPVTARRQFLFAANRTAVYYDKYWQKQKLIHFISKPGDGYRLLEHFYTYIFFENEFMDRFFKRFVRDYVHYMDVIFCKAALIINQLMKESGGKYNAFHIRRGEFQYKVVKIPSEKILNNIKKFIPKNQLVYVASDERNKTFFKAFKDYFPSVRYLDDFTELADLKNVNPNYLGMIDQVICSRAQFFVGTWFSTFSGYITRMRGYFGYADKSVWYGDMEHRDRFQKPEQPKFPFYMREWNNSWHMIDET